jgi:hypothetical protein
MPKKVLSAFCFSGYLSEKRKEIEQAIRDAHFALCEYPACSGEICVRSDKRESMQALPVRLESIAPGIKMHGPM